MLFFFFAEKLQPNQKAQIKKKKKRLISQPSIDNYY